MARLKTKRAAPVGTGGDPREIANASRLGNSDANKPKPEKQPPRRPPAAELAAARKWREQYRRERERAKAKAAASPAKAAPAPASRPGPAFAPGIAAAERNGARSRHRGGRS